MTASFIAIHGDNDGIILIIIRLMLIQSGISQVADDIIYKRCCFYDIFVVINIVSAFQ